MDSNFIHHFILKFSPFTLLEIPNAVTGSIEYKYSQKNCLQLQLGCVFHDDRDPSYGDDYKYVNNAELKLDYNKVNFKSKLEYRHYYKITLLPECSILKYNGIRLNFNSINYSGHYNTCLKNHYDYGFLSTPTCDSEKTIFYQQITLKIGIDFLHGREKIYWDNIIMEYYYGVGIGMKMNINPPLVKGLDNGSWGIFNDFGGPLLNIERDLISYYLNIALGIRFGYRL